MKVRTTRDYSDTERIVIGAIKAGELKPATREQIEAYAAEIVGAALAAGVKRLESVQADLVADIGKG